MHLNHSKSVLDERIENRAYYINFLEKIMNVE